ncbi:KNL1 protein, partial [Upupa epops]|nr:KNL1 protein [Upupa epops]
DNTEHMRGKRLSSILKAPRIPLDDLGNGNEPTQDISAERRKKNSRRVSFANTIKVFQSDLKNSVAEAESTGMNTLLHAPIQASVPQAEVTGGDSWSWKQRRPQHDTTLLFSGDSEMDMTASHTAVITRDLGGKVDVAVFLAELNSGSARAEGSTEFSFFPDPTDRCGSSVGRREEEEEEDATAVKKIDFNEFLLSLKSGEKAPGPAEGPEKENAFHGPSHALAERAPAAAAPRRRDRAPDQHDPQPRADRGAAGAGDQQDPGARRAVRQEAGAMSALPGLVSSQTVFRADRAVVLPECDDMDITEPCPGALRGTGEAGSSCQEPPEEPLQGSSSLTESSRPARGDGDAAGALMPLDKARALPLPSGSGEQLGKAAQDPGVASVSAGFNPRASSGAADEQEEMEMTKCHAVVIDGQGRGAPAEPRRSHCQTSSRRKESRSAGRQPPAEDMELTRPHTALLRAGLVEGREAAPAAPADKTLVFPQAQDMEITASHTVAVNSNAKGFES